MQTHGRSPFSKFGAISCESVTGAFIDHVLYVQVFSDTADFAKEEGVSSRCQSLTSGPASAADITPPHGSSPLQLWSPIKVWVSRCDRRRCLITIHSQAAAQDKHTLAYTAAPVDNFFETKFKKKDTATTTKKRKKKAWWWQKKVGANGGNKPTPGETEVRKRAAQEKKVWRSVNDAGRCYELCVYLSSAVCGKTSVIVLSPCSKSTTFIFHTRTLMCAR